MDYLPVFFSLKDRDCLVVGGGAVARRKVDLLLRAGAGVTVVAPKIEATLAELAAEGRVAHLPDVFHPDMLAGKALIVSATEKKEVNRRVAEAAQARNIPVNVVDDPDLCSIIFPAIVDRSPVVIAVSTGGASPVLARLLKARLESLIPVAYGQLAALAGEWREKVKNALEEPEARRKFWERVFQGPAARLFLSGRREEAHRAMEEELASSRSGGPPAGSVTVLCVDFDDPEALTLKALRHLQEADVIVHDPDVPGETLDMARRDAERIVVGKVSGQRSCPRANVPGELVRLAREGLHVVRPRRGFSPQRVGRDDELQALTDHGIEVRIVP